MGEFAGHLKEWTVDLGACGTEDRQLLSILPLVKEHERLEEFIDGGHGDSQILGRGVGFGDHDDARQEVSQQFSPLRGHDRVRVEVLEERFDEGARHYKVW